MIEMFKTEIEDGLSDLFSSSLSYTTEIKLSPAFEVANATKEFREDIAERYISALAGQLEDQPQPDLYYLYCILVTLGWNLNDDVFLRDEVAKAANTPVDKPFNKMHNQDEIIGHMIASRLLDTDYQTATEGNFEHVAVNSVIYKAWRDPKKKEEILSTIAEIEDGKWKVSMECLFSKFDYGLITPTGEQIIVARTPETSYLTKHLRAYKGSGTFQNNKIGRVLRNITFCGKGLVENPGNPYSIIFNSNKKFFGAVASADYLKEKVMNETEKLAFEQAKAELAAAHTALAEFKTKSVEQAQASLKTAIAERDTQIAGLQKDLGTVTTNLSQANELLVVANAVKVETVANLEKAVAELTALKSEVTLASRKAALAAVVAADRIESTLASIGNLPDAAFNSFISTLAAFKPFEKKDDKDAKDKKEKDAKADMVGKDDKEDDASKAADLAKAELDKDVFNTQASLKVNEAFNKIKNFMQGNIAKPTKGDK